MLTLSLAALIAAALVTVLEMTEVVALVFAVNVEAKSLRPGGSGAVVGVAVIALVALGFGAAILAVPDRILVAASAIVLGAFGVALFRSTLETFRGPARPSPSEASPPSTAATLAFGGGFVIGAVEATEAVVVLLALTAAGYGLSAVLGAVIGGSAVAIAAALVHDRIRRVKLPWVKLAATALVVSFAIFWAGEALGVAWPGDDLFLLPLVVVVALAIRGLLGLARRSHPGAPTPGGVA